MTTRGELSDINLPLLIQLTCGRKASALIQVRRQRLEQGRLTVHKGEIVHARIGHLEGEMAVYEMLKWQTGRFCLHEILSLPFKRTVHKPWQKLLVEGKRRLRIPQSANGLAAVDLLQTVPPLPNITAEDARLETTLIHLLSVLEHLRGELVVEGRLERPLTVLSILMAMSNTTIEWYGKLRPDPMERSILPQVLAEVVETEPAVRLFNLQKGRLKADSIQLLFKNWPSSQLSQQRMAQNLNTCLMEIIEAYLERLLQKLHGSALADPWRVTFRNFLIEIDNLIA